MAEFGFLGVVVYTRTQTPRRWGQESNAGDFLLSTSFLRPFLTNCCIVGILYFLKRYLKNFERAKVQNLSINRSVVLNYWNLIPVG
jgi:hypothetical protein